MIEESLRPPGSPGARKWRVALYSHDTMGFGHVRRNLLIAQALARSPLDAVVLMIAGAPEAGGFVLPAGVDCVTLPALRKEVDGQYASRRLDLSLRDLVAVRAETIRAALTAFEPDVLIVDNVPRGAAGELELALSALRRRNRTHVVLGLRDVLDDPAAVRREWRRLDNEAAIGDFYDAVWVYGDRTVYDPIAAYGFGQDISAKARYVGYFDQRARLVAAAHADDPSVTLRRPSHRLALCLVGGGDDGARLAAAFAHAELPEGYQGIILTGTRMPVAARRRLTRIAAARPRLHVVESVSEPVLLTRRADRIVAMGGYNTICEILSFEKRALIVPRVKPRREQLIRTQRFCELGLVDMLQPGELSARALTEWLARDGPPPRVDGRVDLGGLPRVLQLLQGVLPSPVVAT